jgi:hypothetical protein
MSVASGLMLQRFPCRRRRGELESRVLSRPMPDWGAGVNGGRCKRARVERLAAEGRSNEGLNNRRNWRRSAEMQAV